MGFLKWIMWNLINTEELYKIIDDNSNMKVQLDHVNAKLPIKADEGSAGYDVFATEHDDIDPAHRKLIDTGIRIEIDKWHYLRVAPRSGLSVTKEMDIGAGVIDSSYRGILKILLINNGIDTFHINPGDKIAQIICERCSNPNITHVGKLSETSRGEGGFGSTGN